MNIVHSISRGTLSGHYLIEDFTKKSDFNKGENYRLQALFRIESSISLLDSISYYNKQSGKLFKPNTFVYLSSIGLSTLLSYIFSNTLKSDSAKKHPSLAKASILIQKYLQTAIKTAECALTVLIIPFASSYYGISFTISFLLSFFKIGSIFKIPEIDLTLSLLASGNLYIAAFIGCMLLSTIYSRLLNAFSNQKQETDPETVRQILTDFNSMHFEINPNPPPLINLLNDNPQIDQEFKEILEFLQTRKNNSLFLDRIKEKLKEEDRYKEELILKRKEDLTSDELFEFIENELNSVLFASPALDQPYINMLNTINVHFKSSDLTDEEKEDILYQLIIEAGSLCASAKNDVIYTIFLSLYIKNTPWNELKLLAHLQLLRESFAANLSHLIFSENSNLPFIQWNDRFIVSIVKILFFPDQDQNDQTYTPMTKTLIRKLSSIMLNTKTSNLLLEDIHYHPKRLISLINEALLTKQDLWAWFSSRLENRSDKNAIKEILENHPEIYENPEPIIAIFLIDKGIIKLKPR